MEEGVACRTCVLCILTNKVHTSYKLPENGEPSNTQV